MCKHQKLLEMQQGNAEAVKELEKLEGEKVTEKQLEMCSRVNGTRCETETVRLLFSQICCFISF